MREVDGRQQKKNGGMLLQIEVPSPGFAGRGLNRLSCVSLPRPPFLVARAHTQAQVNDLHPNEKTQPPEKKKPSEEHTIPEPASRVRHSFRCPQENEEVNCKPRVLHNNKLNKKDAEKGLSSVHTAINPLIPAARDIASLKIYAQMEAPRGKRWDDWFSAHFQFNEALPCITCVVGRYTDNRAPIQCAFWNPSHEGKGNQRGCYPSCPVDDHGVGQLH